MILEFYHAETGEALGGHRGSFTTPRIGEYIRIDGKVWHITAVVWTFDTNMTGPLVVSLMLESATLDPLHVAVAGKEEDDG